MEPAALPVTKAMLAIERLTASRRCWPLVGASHVRRGLFSILLIAAEKAGDWTLARALLRERMELHSASTQTDYAAAMAAPVQ